MVVSKYASVNQKRYLIVIEITHGQRIEQTALVVSGMWTSSVKLLCFVKIKPSLADCYTPVFSDFYHVCSGIRSHGNRVRERKENEYRKLFGTPLLHHKFCAIRMFKQSYGVVSEYPSVQRTWFIRPQNGTECFWNVTVHTYFGVCRLGTHSTTDLRWCRSVRNSIQKLLELNHLQMRPRNTCLISCEWHSLDRRATKWLVIFATGTACRTRSATLLALHPWVWVHLMHGVWETVKIAWYPRFLSSWSISKE